MLIFRTPEGYRKGIFIYKGYKITLINTGIQVEFIVSKNNSDIDSGVEKSVKLAYKTGKELIDKLRKEKQ